MAGSLAVLNVDRTDDDASFDDCLDPVPNDCSLRGAIHRAHLIKVGVVIELPAGTFELTINGASEDLNATGDLDIRRNLTIRGQGPSRTIISGGEMATLDDRLIEVHAPDRVVNFESLTITAGAPPSGLHSVFVGTSNTVDFLDCTFSAHGDEVTGGGATEDGARHLLSPAPFEAAPFGPAQVRVSSNASAAHWPVSAEPSV